MADDLETAPDGEASPAGAVGWREDVRVAVVGPFSGPRAAWGELLSRAVRRYATPGIAWDMHDDLGDTACAEQRAREVIADGRYRAVIGHFNSYGARAALPHYRRAGIPVLLPLSTGTGLLDGGGGGALRWCADDHGQVVALAAAAHRLGVGELLVTDDGSAYGAALAADFLGLAGPVRVRRLSAESDVPCAGAIAVCGTHVGAAATAARLRAAGFGGVLYFPDDCAVPEFAELVAGHDGPALVARLAGGAVRHVEEAFAALTGALTADPAARGADLLATVRAHAGLRFTGDGDPERADPGAGWEIVGLDEIRSGPSPLVARAGGGPDVDSLVIGTGIIGSASAAAIAELGCRVALIGPGPDGPSATRHSGGLIRAYDPDPRLRQLAVHSFRLLWGHPAEHTRGYGFRRTGSLVLLRQSDLDEAARGVAELVAAGLDAELIGQRDLRDRWPDLAVDDVAGAVWEPGGGYTASLATASAYRAHALRLGALGWQGRVLGVRPHANGVRVETDAGSVTARTAVVATGSGIPDLRNRNGSSIGPMARVKRIRYGWFDARGRRLPIMADLVTGMWGRPNLHGESFLTGRPVDEWDVPPSGGDALTPEQVDYIRSGAARRWPWLADAGYLGGRFGADLYGQTGPAIGAMCGDLPVVAAGVFSGAGVKSAPAAAELAAQTVRALLAPGTQKIA